METEFLLNDFAIRSFRDTADGEYIAARLLFRARLAQQFLWSSLHCLEKYLKCILVLNRINAKKGGHDLGKIINIFKSAKKFPLTLSSQTEEFILYLDTYGRHRYYESSYFLTGDELVRLDFAVWEVRRYAQILDQTIDIEGMGVNILPLELEKIKLSASRPFHEFKIANGKLENIIANKQHPSRDGLIWQNLYFGMKSRKEVKMPSMFEAGNSPLTLHPEILDEVLKYVYFPQDMEEAYRNHNP